MTERELKRPLKTQMQTKMLSNYRIPPSNTHTRKQKTPNHSEHDLKMTSNDHIKTSNELKMISSESKKTVSEKIQNEK